MYYTPDVNNQISNRYIAPPGLLLSGCQDKKGTYTVSISSPQNKSSNYFIVRLLLYEYIISIIVSCILCKNESPQA